MIAYKVLRIGERGGLYSSNSMLSGVYKKNYRRNMRNHPKVAGTKLFVFSSLRAARRFNLNRNEIWRVEVPNKVTKTNEIPDTVEDFNLSNYWRGNRKVNYTPMRKPPAGTLLVDWVRLVEPV